MADHIIILYSSEMAFKTKFNCENCFKKKYVNPQIFVSFDYILHDHVILHFVASVAVQLGISDIALTMVVPWSLPDDLQDDTSEQKTIIERIFKEEVIFF